MARARGTNAAAVHLERERHEIDEGSANGEGKGQDGTLPVVVRGLS